MSRRSLATGILLGNCWLEAGICCSRHRAGILFKQFPDIKAVCYYALRLGKIFTDYIDKDVACAKNLEVGVKNRTFIMEVCCI